VIPNGDPAAIVHRALTLLVAELEKTRIAATTRPCASRNATAGSRHVPATVKRHVWARDHGQCAFVGTKGRCTERGLLEIHHVVPFAAGGPTTVQNLELRCRRHNACEAERFFGPLLAREERAVYGATRFRPKGEKGIGA
jgi:5-methylcytosine-specific restriction endonuclease McrA